MRVDFFSFVFFICSLTLLFNSRKKGCKVKRIAYSFSFNACTLSRLTGRITPVHTIMNIVFIHIHSLYTVHSSLITFLNFDLFIRLFLLFSILCEKKISNQRKQKDKVNYSLGKNVNLQQAKTDNEKKTENIKLRSLSWQKIEETETRNGKENNRKTMIIIEIL